MDVVGDVEQGEAGDHVEDVLADALREVGAEGGLVHLDDRTQLGAAPRRHCLVPLAHPPPAAGKTDIGKTADLPEHLLLPMEAHGGEDEGDLRDVLPQQASLTRPSESLEVLATLEKDDDQLNKKLLQKLFICLIQMWRRTSLHGCGNSFVARHCNLHQRFCSRHHN